MMQETGSNVRVTSHSTATHLTSSQSRILMSFITVEPKLARDGREKERERKRKEGMIEKG